MKEEKDVKDGLGEEEFVELMSQLQQNIWDATEDGKNMTFFFCIPDRKTVETFTAQCDNPAHAAILKEMLAEGLFD